MKHAIDVKSQRLQFTCFCADVNINRRNIYNHFRIHFIFTPNGLDTKVMRAQTRGSSAPWALTTLNATRLALLQTQPDTAWHGGGVLIIDETGEGCADVPFARKGMPPRTCRVSIWEVSGKLIAMWSV